MVNPMVIEAAHATQFAATLLGGSEHIIVPAVNPMSSDQSVGLMKLNINQTFRWLVTARTRPSGSVTSS